MPSFNGFPMEIIQEILKQLPQPTLYQCIYVCKALYTPAIYVFYQELNMRAANIELLHTSSFGTPQQSANYTISNGELVKRLNIHQHLSTKKTGWIIDIQFSPLLQHLPNLRIIDLSSTTKHRAYLKYLYESATITQENLPHLQRIIVDSNTSSIGQEVYFSSCYKFRKSITHLTIYPLYQHYLVLKGQQKGVNNLYFLPEFKNLTHLHLDGVYYTSVQDEYLTIYPVLKVCPKLVSLSMNSSCRISAVTAQEFLASVNSGQAAPVTDITTTAIDTSHNHTVQLSPSALVVKPKGHYAGLKNVDLELPNFPQAYMVYFMSYVCNTRLQTFNLSIEQTTFNIWIDENGEDTVMNFAKYLSCIGNVCINIGRKYHHYGPPPEDTELLLKHDAARFWKFVNLIKGNRNLAGTLGLKIHEERCRDPSLEIIIQNSRRMDLKYEFGTNANFMDDENGIIKTTSFMVLCIPAMEWASINKVYLDIALHEENVTSIFNVPHMLEYVLFNGSNLTGLVINRFHRYHYQSPIVLQRNKLAEINRSQQIIFNAANDESRLTELILTSVEISSPLMGILNGSLCSNTRTLNLNNCKFVTNDHRNVSLDLTGLGHLEQFVLDTTLLDLKHRRYVFFKFTLINKDSDDSERITYYKYEKKTTTGGNVTFVPTTKKFIKSYKRISSNHTTLVDVKLATKNVNITLLASFYMNYRDVQTETLIQLSNNE